MRKFAIAGALALALSTAACTPDQTQQTLTGLNLACAGLAVGTTVVVQVASTISGAAPVASVAGTVGTASGAACSTLIPAVKSLVDEITDKGGTATITATTTDPTTKVKTVRRMTVAPNAAPFFTGTVSPSGGLF